MIIQIPGPFDIMYPNSESVDFTSTITTGYMSVIVPITTKNDIWSFVNPLEFEVWIFWIISIPIFIVSMGVADYIANRCIDWDTLVVNKLSVLLDGGPVIMFITARQFPKGLCRKRLNSPTGRR